jgi:membrane protease subunit HflK
MVNLQEVTVPDEVKNAFDMVNTARQKKDQIINQANATRNSKVPAARGQAQKTILEAEAYRDRKILEVTGETRAFLKQYQTYKQAERETRTRLYMETMERALVNCGDKVFLDESVKGILPHLDLGGSKGGAR